MKSNSLKLKVYIFIFIAVVYLFFASGRPWTEAINQLDVARNLIQNHSLLMDERTSEISTQSKGGQWYDPHGITNVFLMTPFVLLERIFKNSLHMNIEPYILVLSSFSGCIINALVSLVFFSLLMLFSTPIKISFYTTLCLAFLTLVFPYANNNYEGNLNMLFILSSLYFLFSFLENKNLLYLILSGVCAGLAINTREFSWIFLFCISLFILFTTLKEKNIKILAIFFCFSISFISFMGIL